MRVSDRGVSFVELAAVLTVLGLVFTMSVPAFWEILAEEALATASREVAGILTAARARAVFQGAEVGVKWVANAGDLVLSVYQDGNGNGVTTADIKKGVDRLVAGPYWLRSVPRYELLVRARHGRPRSGRSADRQRLGPRPIRQVGHLLFLARRKRVARLGLPLEPASGARRPCGCSPTTAKIQIWTWHGK